MQIKRKIFSVCILIALATVITPLTATALPDSTSLTITSGSNTITLTASDLLAMPSYTGVGAVRSGGYISQKTIGNYTGVPILYLCNLAGGVATNSIVKFRASDGYSSTIDYSQVHDNSFTQYNISTNTVITGQNPIIILAYAVNGSEIPSPSAGEENDLGGPLRVMVVSNNGTSSIMANDGMATFGNIMAKYVTSIEIINPPTTSLIYNTCDALGTTQNMYNLGDSIFFTATGLSTLTTYPVYVVQDVAVWNARVPLPTRVIDTTTSLTTDSSGNIVPTSIYPNAQPGQYDVIIDVNNNGEFDEADLLINNIVATAGIFVAPEYSLGTLIALTACFIAFIAFAALKSRNLSHINAHKHF